MIGEIKNRTLRRTAMIIALVPSLVFLLIYLIADFFVVCGEAAYKQSKIAFSGYKELCVDLGHDFKYWWGRDGEV